ncbi:Ribokinase-like protein [Athelia psychrophila]|uniref:Ribokinase-like protein n=1 Tax=Athelia psychrophila TaxID=1759441 RepID=A0A166N5P0_9AGAM|nr:Ribokinase-like protein [Fibularhizoctonia sp. CBS 109695]
MAAKHFVSLGMFILDEFAFHDENGEPTGKTMPPQERLLICGGTYAAIGARIWLSPHEIGMVVDRGHDWSNDVQKSFDAYGSDMWMFRDHPDLGTCRAINSYKGDNRSFEYLTPRIRLSPRDLRGTLLERATTLHLVCSPSRAADIVSEIREINGWHPTTIFEPIPYRCVPEELPALKAMLSSISILSPNAEEALGLLALPGTPTKELIEQAAGQFLDMGVGEDGAGYAIIRSGAMGAYAASRAGGGKWVEAFWMLKGTEKVVDVTGAGNSFLGGLAAGLRLANGNVLDAVFYATVSAGFIIEQEGLPHLSTAPSARAAVETWNGDSPQRRLEELRRRHE